LFSGTDGHVTTIAVDPPWHRSGIGARLLLQLTRDAIQRGATALTLEVRVGNEAAQSLYRTFGYSPAGVRKGYYVETGEDALFMWAHDVDRPDYAGRLERIGAAIRGRTIIGPMEQP
jgi:ribosomal-protein-alanine N-acetyltransferase